MKSLIVLFLVYYVGSTIFKKLMKQGAAPQRPAPEPQPVREADPEEMPASSPFAAPEPDRQSPGSFFSLLGIEQDQSGSPAPDFTDTEEPEAEEYQPEEISPVAPTAGQAVPEPVKKPGAAMPRLRITARTAREGIVLAEVLGPCKALQKDGAGY